MGKSLNFSASIVTFTSAGADVENAIPHTTPSIPSGFIIVKQNAPGKLYLSTTPWTSTFAYLKSSTAAVTYSVLFFA
jgi:hypothetical protein